MVSEDDDLRVALENANWDMWCIYLHPSQRAIAYRTYGGPFRVCGSAGTGKTVVALHHARHLLESDVRSRVAVLTYSADLASDLRLLALQVLKNHGEALPRGISPQFALSEFERIVEPRQLRSEADYLKTVRRGVHTRLSSEKRRAIWAVFQEVYDTERNLLYVACTRARDYLLITSAGIPSELLLDMDNDNRAL